MVLTREDGEASGDVLDHFKSEIKQHASGRSRILIAASMDSLDDLKGKAGFLVGNILDAAMNDLVPFARENLKGISVYASEGPTIRRDAVGRSLQWS